LSDPPPHEVRPCADPNDAGTSWRAEKLKDLVWRAKCLGVRDLPAVQALEREMRDATAVLDAMAVEQSAPEYARPWWKDGEYDEARAEAANDRGMEAYAERRFRDAHAAFTARLAGCPPPAPCEFVQLSQDMRYGTGMRFTLGSELEGLAQ